MKERTRNIIVGFTALGGLVVLGFLIMLFGYVPPWLEKGYQLQIQLANASGLTQGSRLRLSGIDIGGVQKVALQVAPEQGVLITALVDPQIKVPREAVVTVEAPLIGGSPTLAFDISRLNSTQLADTLPTDGSAKIKGQSLTLVSQFAGELRAAIAEPSEQFKRIAENFEKLSTEWAQVGRNLAELTAARSVSDVDAGKAPGNLASVLARADQRMMELQKLIDGLNSWLNDPQIREDVQQTLKNTRTATEKFGQTADSVRSLAEDARGHLDELAKRYAAVASDLSAAISALKQTVDQAREGQGTVGKLINDPALFDNLNNAATRLEKVLEEAQLLIEKWKSEGLPVRF